MTLDPWRIEVMEEDMAQVLRRKTGAERLAILFDLMEAGREYITAGVRWQHPDWSDDQVSQETARRFARESR